MGSTRRFAELKITLGNELVSLLEVVFVIVGCPSILLWSQQASIQKQIWGNR